MPLFHLTHFIMNHCSQVLIKQANCPYDFYTNLVKLDVVTFYPIQILCTCNNLPKLIVK